MLDKGLHQNLRKMCRIGNLNHREIPIKELSIDDSIVDVVHNAIDCYAMLPLGIEFIVKASAIPIYIGEDWEVIADYMAKTERQFNAIVFDTMDTIGMFYNDKTLMKDKIPNHFFAIAISIEVLRESHDHIESILLHEIGHYLSNIAGDLSGRDDLKKAYLIDLRALSSIDEPDRDLTPYLLRRVDVHVSMNDAREEVFAEIFAEIFYDDGRPEDEKISNLMPRCRAVMEKMVQELDDCGMRLRSNYGLTYFDNIARTPQALRARPR